jgi:AcrR family transcriptional regulator
MSSPRALLWIEEGYQMVARNGIKGINIEAIARSIQKNKSSFYHYFGDLEIFEAALLDFHVQQAENLAEQIYACDRIRPDVLKVFLDNKIDLFFHKQLRINREYPQYKSCFEQAFSKMEEAFVDKWADFLGLQHQPLFAASFLHLIAENFLLKITTVGWGLVVQLWLVPALIAQVLLAITFDWLPHHPHEEQARYRNTRIFDIPVLNWLMLGQNYHLVHHLYPRIPFYHYQKAYGSLKKEFMEEEVEIISLRADEIH